jgi:hypothetical protein
MNELDVAFHGPRGVSLAAVLNLPERATEAAPVPGIVLCQGLSGVKHLVLPEVAAHLASHGLASLRFDYAGYGDSAGERGWIDPRARVDDAAGAFEFLASHEAIDSGRIGAYGHSYGGPVAITLASDQPRVRAVVSVSGPGNGVDLLRSLRTSWEWIAFKHRVEEERTRFATTGDGTLVEVDEIFPFSPAFKAAYEELKRTAGGTSAIAAGDEIGTRRFWLASVDAILEFNPSDAARRLAECPLLLVHGEDDDVAPVETVEPVYTNASGVKRWIVLPGMGHNDLDSDPGLTTAIDLAAAWFIEHLS